MRRDRLLPLALGPLLVAGWLGAQETGPSIRDADLGLAKGSVFEVPTPPVAAVNSSDPGDLPLVPRAFDTAPPRVPHAVLDFMPIRRDENWCVDCHMSDWRAPQEGEPTPIPASHYVDLRIGSGEIGDRIVGARWVCVSCHVAVTDAPLLVENTFGQ